MDHTWDIAWVVVEPKSMDRTPYLKFAPHHYTDNAMGLRHRRPDDEYDRPFPCQLLQHDHPYL